MQGIPSIIASQRLFGLFSMCDGITYKFDSNKLSINSCSDSLPFNIKFVFGYSDFNFCLTAFTIKSFSEIPATCHSKLVYPEFQTLYKNYFHLL